MKGTRVVTLTAEMQALDHAWRAWTRLGSTLRCWSLSAPSVYFLDAGQARELTRGWRTSTSRRSWPPPADASGRSRACRSIIPKWRSRSSSTPWTCWDSEGVILGTIVDGRRLDSPELRPPFEEVDRRRTPILLHPMTPWGVEQMGDLRLAPLTGFMFDTTLTAKRMVFSGMLEELPNLKLILPHTDGTIPYL